MYKYFLRKLIFVLDCTTTMAEKTQTATDNQKPQFFSAKLIKLT